MRQAVILAGGLGTRMRPHTETVAKPMLPVQGKPFVEHQIDLLRAQGIQRFLLLVAYLGDQIEAHFGDGARWGVTIAYSYEPSPLGTGGALQNAVSCLDSEFLLLNGDTLLEIDYTALISDFRRSAKLALVVATRKETGPGNLLLGENNVVRDYSKRQPRGQHVDAGVIALRKEIVNLIPPNRPSSLEEEVFPQLIQQQELRAWPTSVTFFDMGTPAGLAALEAHLA